MPGPLKEGIGDDADKRAWTEPGIFLKRAGFASVEFR
jgi:hypothetical protein